jgi:hypothetical protein
VNRLLLILCAVCSANARSLTFDALHSARGFTWASHPSAGFDFYFEQRSAAERDIEKVAHTMEASRAHIDELLGGGSSIRIPVFLVDSRARMKDLTGSESNGLAGRAVLAAIYSDTIKAIGGHETCHVLARSLWGNPHGMWINEGLAVYADDQWWGLPLHSVARGLDDRHQLLRLKDLLPGGWDKKYPDVITYPELGSFVKFVYEKYGREAVKEMWQHGTSSEFSRMEEGWRAKLAKAEPKSIDYTKSR